MAWVLFSSTRWTRVSGVEEPLGAVEKASFQQLLQLGAFIYHNFLQLPGPACVSSKSRGAGISHHCASSKELQHPP